MHCNAFFLIVRGELINVDGWKRLRQVEGIFWKKGFVNYFLNCIHEHSTTTFISMVHSIGCMRIRNMFKIIELSDKFLTLSARRREFYVLYCSSSWKIVWDFSTFTMLGHEGFLLVCRTHTHMQKRRMHFHVNYIWKCGTQCTLCISPLDEFEKFCSI